MESFFEAIDNLYEFDLHTKGGVEYSFKCKVCTARFKTSGGGWNHVEKFHLDLAKQTWRADQENISPEDAGPTL